MGSGGSQPKPQKVIYKMPKFPKFEMPEAPAPAKPAPPPSPPATKSNVDVQEAARLQWINRIRRSGYEKTLVAPTTPSATLG